MWNPRERIASFLGPVTGNRVFDFGCGMGEEAMYFARTGGPKYTRWTSRQRA